MKLRNIRNYAKRKEQYNLSQRPADDVLLDLKEQVDLHLIAVDIVTYCARNSPFCIA